MASGTMAAPRPSAILSRVKPRSLFMVRTAQLILLNCALFIAYRLLFIALFATGVRLREIPTLLLAGLRVDAALLALELIALALVALASRRLRFGATLRALWLLTYLNALAAAVNFFFFQERNQHLWEMLFAHIGRPREVWVALEPFVYKHPVLISGALLLTLLTALAFARRTSALAGQSLELRGRRAVLLTAAGIVVVFAVTNLQVYWHWKPSEGDGELEVYMVSSLKQMRFGNYALNQAVINPMHDLIRLYLPGQLMTVRHQLDPGEALAGTLALLGLTPAHARYPLLRTIRGQADLGISSVVVILVEGLGGSILDHRVGDAYLMRHLRALGEQGLYFPNIVKGFSDTSGSVFVTVTSLPRTFGVRRGGIVFFPHEINGRYGTLPRVLGDRIQRHYYVAGFRQRSVDFERFMASQDYTVFGYDAVHARLGPRAREETNALGIFDGPMLREAAEIILASPGPFTAHIVTATTHSPWSVPSSMTDRVPHDGLAAFQYADRSIHEFIEKLRLERPDFDQILFVIIGDHTSIELDGRLIEHLRVPLTLFSPRLARLKDRWASRQGVPGSHLDILPTVLGLIEGEHLYSGMGRNLLTTDAGPAGIISGNYQSTLYVKDGFALWYWPESGRHELVHVPQNPGARAAASEDPDKIAKRLKREFLAIWETADHLARERRVFPPRGEAALGTGR